MYEHMQLSEANLAALNRENGLPKTMTDSILVIGGGELGLCVLEGLAAHPRRKKTKVSVLLRQATLDSAAPEKKRLVQRAQALGVRFEAADVVRASVAELAAVFSQYDTVVSCSGMGLPAGTQTKLARAALQGKVRRYFPWQFGMDYDAIGEGSSQDLFDEQLAVRRMLRGQAGTEWVIISTGLFMSFLFAPAFGVVDLGARTVRALGSWDTRITVTTPRDIGRATAEAALDPRGIRNEVVYTAGDTLSYGELADLLEERFAGTGFARELWDADALARQLDGEDPGAMAKYRATFAQGRGVAWAVEGTLNAARGMEMEGVREYLRGMEMPS